jgi:hypothetical protein
MFAMWEYVIVGRMAAPSLELVLRAGDCRGTLTASVLRATPESASATVQAGRLVRC